MDRKNIVQIRMDEFAQSCALLGVTDYEVWKIPDNGVADFNQAALVKMITDEIAQYTPDTVITFARDGYTGHKDHEATHCRVVEAVRSLSSKLAPRVFGITMPKELISQAMPILTARRKTASAYRPCLTDFAPSLSSVEKVPMDLGLKRCLVEIYQSQALGGYLELFQLPGMGEFYLPIRL